MYEYEDLKAVKVQVTCTTMQDALDLFDFCAERDIELGPIDVYIVPKRSLDNIKVDLVISAKKTGVEDFYDDLL